MGKWTGTGKAHLHPFSAAMEVNNILLIKEKAEVLIKDVLVFNLQV